MHSNISNGLVLPWLGYRASQTSAAKAWAWSIRRAASFMSAAIKPLFTNWMERLYHEMMARRKDVRRGLYLQAHIHRATARILRQFRYVRFLKTDWQRRLRLPYWRIPNRTKRKSKKARIDLAFLLLCCVPFCARISANRAAPLFVLKLRDENSHFA